MDTIYIGVDFHARQQTICSLKTQDGEFVIDELKHQNKDEVRAFYSQFSGRVIATCWLKQRTRLSKRTTS